MDQPILKSSTGSSRAAGFTLIELLIVVAIIAILAAIAVPNFLEAQTRAKVSRAASDMRSIATAIEAYVVDNNNEPKTLNAAPPTGGRTFSNWWGFTFPGNPTTSNDILRGGGLTTPVAYMTSLPYMPFRDQAVTTFWRSVTGGTSEGQQFYTIVRDTTTPVNWYESGNLFGGNAPAGSGVIPVQTTADFGEQAKRAGYIIYTAGPDGIDSTVWGSPVIYDPTNGTVSYGDVYRFGSGSPADGDRTE